MIRKFMFAFLALGIVSVSLLAEEYTGKVKSVDVDKNKIVITVPDADGGQPKDKEFTVSDETKFVKAGKKGTELPDKLKNKVFKAEGTTATITTEKKGDKEVVTEVKTKAAKSGKKKKDN